MRGHHAIKCWAKTQQTVALSSGEAELYAAVRTGSEAMGLRSVMRDVGINPEIRLKLDATAAIGMLMKEGLSGVRHIDTQYLWLQDSIRCKDVVLKKVDGKVNVADAFTKALGAHDLDGHLWNAGFRW